MVMYSPSETPSIGVRIQARSGNDISIKLRLSSGWKAFMLITNLYLMFRSSFCTNFAIIYTCCRRQLIVGLIGLLFLDSPDNQLFSDLIKHHTPTQDFQNGLF